MPKVLLGVTGSVAAVVAPKLAQALSDSGFGVRIIVTEKSLYFCKLGNFAYSIPVYRNNDEWNGLEYKKDSEVLHIELRKWADILLIAPLTANTLAKLANGLADNLLTSVARAWDTTKPVVIAPAMNTLMWEHPATNEHLSKLIRWYPALRILHPVVKILACGDTGVGALAPIETIVEEVKICAH